MSNNTFIRLNNALGVLEDEFPTINMGGCGFTALYIGEQMEKRGYPIKYVLISDKIKHETSLSAFREFKSFSDAIKLSIREVNDRKFYIGHIVVYYKGLMIDPEGVQSWENTHRYRREQIITTTLTREIIEHWVCQSGWNPAFEREHLPKIKERITEIFNEVFNQ